MLDGLADGSIDAIATDHAPHHADEKALEFDRCAVRGGRSRDGRAAGARPPRAPGRGGPAPARGASSPGTRPASCASRGARWPPVRPPISQSSRRMPSPRSAASRFPLEGAEHPLRRMAAPRRSSRDPHRRTRGLRERRGGGRRGARGGQRFVDRGGLRDHPRRTEAGRGLAPGPLGPAPLAGLGRGAGAGWTSRGRPGRAPGRGARSRRRRRSRGSRRRGWRRPRAPQAIASSTDVPRPSVTELITNTSKPLSSARASVPEPGQDDVPLEAQPGDLRGQRAVKLSRADDHEARVRNLPHHARRGVEQVPLALVRHQRRDVADDRRALRQPEFPVHVERRQPGDAVDVDPLVDDDGSSCRHPVVDQHCGESRRTRRGSAPPAGTSSATADCGGGGSRRAARPRGAGARRRRARRRPRPGPARARRARARRRAGAGAGAGTSATRRGGPARRRRPAGRGPAR